MKILLADDHAMFREGMRRLLADSFPGAEFGQSGTTQETLELIHQQRWDVVLLDIFMPGRGGLEVLKEIRERQPSLPVLVLSGALPEEMGLRALKSGASGYLDKQAASKDLVTAIQQVLKGGKYANLRLMEALIGELASPVSAPFERLSERELQVMRLLVAGKSLKVIAADLSLSPKTISTFRARLLRKLSLENDAQLVRYALEHGFAPEN